MKPCAVTLLTLLLAAPALAAPPACLVPDNSAQEAPHYQDGVYFNPYDSAKDKSLFSYLRMRWKTPHPTYDPAEHHIPTTETDTHALHNPPAAPQITWVGHATVLIQYRGINIITDPMFSDRASPLQWAGPQRLQPLPVQLADLPPIDYVLLSHNHYDHMDTDTIQRIGNSAIWLIPLDNLEYLTDAGVDKARIIEFDWWDQHNLSGLNITATPSRHWSKRTLWDTNKALWAAWHIDFGDFTLWFGGDTGYNDVLFKRIGERCGAVDLALIPIGAYAPQWFMGAGHVTPEQALKIHHDVRARQSMGIHWGTFILTAEPPDAPPKRLAQARKTAGMGDDEFFVLPVGATRTLKPN